MREKTGIFRSVYRSLQDMGGFALIPVAAVVLIVGALGALVASPFVEHVSGDEIVVCETSSGGDKDVQVWRASEDSGWRWQGFCEVTTYHESASYSFKEPLDVGGTHYTVRGTARFRIFGDDAKILALHRTYGSEKAIFRGQVMPRVAAAMREAAEDPDWAAPKGSWLERKAKGALEYTLHRISPTGHMWTAPETRQALEVELNRRLSGTANADGVPVEIRLGFVVDR